MEENYIQILEESLAKKIKVLDEIKILGEEQKEAISDEDFDMEGFDSFIERKEILIKSLEELDSGFEVLYERVADELKDNREKYADSIHKMQEMIRLITEKSNSIQAQEARNKAAIEEYFSRKKNEVRAGRVSSKAAMNYYNMQRNSAYVDPQFMDDKK